MKIIAVAAILTLLGGHHLCAQTMTPLTLQQTILLPGVTGKFDHFAVDLAKGHLFAAATGHHSVEVIDLKSGSVLQSLAGLGKPHGLVWGADTGSLYVADGSLGEVRVYQGSPLKLTGTLKLSDDADDMVYDQAAHILYVGHGGSNAANPARIAVIDTAKFALIANLPVTSHPEAIDLNAQGQRVYANIADAGEIAVIDTIKRTIAAEWKLADVADNVPLAHDGEHGVLYVACRTPATLLALDEASGAELSRVPTGKQADDLFYDATLRRVYVISGAGEVDVYQVDSPRKLYPLGITHTEAGAKTALFVPSQGKLYVGIPGVDGRSAKISVYSTTSIGGSK